MLQPGTIRGDSKADGLRRALRARIESMRPDDQLMSEPELADQYGVSYSTVRRVTDQLAREGYLEKIQGKGTFVAEREGATQQKSTTIIYANPWCVHGNPFFVRCLQGVLDESDRCGYRLQVFRCPEFGLGGQSFEQLCD